MKKNLYLCLAFLVCFTPIIQKAEAKTTAKAKPKAAAVCTSVITLPNSKFVYKNSAPVRGGRDEHIIGYRVEPTLIMYSSSLSSRSGTKIYDLTGNLIGSCPWASADGAAGGRFRCTMNTRNLRRAALRNTKNPSVLIAYRGSACVKVPDAGRCYGSNKGPCNQVLG